MNVLLFSKYEDLGASSRVRALQYIPALVRKGVNVDCNALITNKMLGDKFNLGKRYSILDFLKRLILRINITRRVDNYDLIWIQKEFMPYFPFWFEWLFLRKSKSIVLDIDDAEYLKYEKSSNPIVKILLECKFRKICANYSTIIVGNSFLREKFITENSGANIVCIPSVIEFKKYQVERKRNSQEKLVIGWIGSPSTQSYVKLVLPAIERLIECVSTRIELHLVGATNNFLNDKPYVKILKWSQKDEISLISKFDIGIMPLDCTEWEEGKCSFKAIQYMAIGIPVVVSPTQSNIEVVGNGSGYVASDIDQWYFSLKELVNDRELRERIGLRNTRKVIDQYTVGSQVDRLRIALISASETP